MPTMSYATTKAVARKNAPVQKSDSRMSLRTGNYTVNYTPLRENRLLAATRKTGGGNELSDRFAVFGIPDEDASIEAP